MIFHINPINLLRALSSALELSNGGLSRHHWRVAMIAKGIGEHVGLSNDQRQVLTYAALMHDLGAASNWAERQHLYEINPGQAIYRHAENGYTLLKDSVQLGMLAEPIRHHHDRWDGTSPSGLGGTAIPLLSRIIHIADRLEIMLKDNVFVFEQRPDILAGLSEQSGMFDPELIHAVEELGRKESFWLDLFNIHYCQNYFQAEMYSGMQFMVDDIINIAGIFATVIDSTSRFTGTHSRSVAKMAAFLATIKGYSAEEVQAMRIAGLMHDLGKLAIPNVILEKPGKLTEYEYAIVRQHPYYTYRILEQIDGFDFIAEWAAFHHENLDGSGYPFRIDGSKISLGSRIVRVADVFASLLEERPYRPAMTREQVEAIMRDMIGNRQLDQAIVAEAFAHYSEAQTLLLTTE